MPQAISDLIAQAATKTAKDLKVDEPEETSKRSEEKEVETEEAKEEETVEEETQEDETTEVEDETPTEQQLKKSTKTVPIERFNEVYGKMKQMERYLGVLTSRMQPPQQQVPAQKEEKEEPLPDLEELTNTDLFNLMRKVLVKDVKGALREAVSPLSNFVSSAQQERADREVSEVAAVNPDYFDYAEQMMEISNRNPQLSAKEVYFLAKGDTKAAQKSVTKRVKEKTELKKKAKVEKRSSASEKIDENKEFKTVRDAGLAIARKMGIA